MGSRESLVVRRGLNLICSVTGEFINHKVRCRSLIRGNYINLVGTISGFSFSGNCGFSACTIPIVVNRVGQLFHSNNTVGIDHSLGRGSVHTRSLESGFIGHRLHRPAINRLTSVLNYSVGRATRVLGIVGPVVSLDSFNRSNGSRLSIPISRSSGLFSCLSLSRILRALSSGRGTVVSCHCCGKRARATATRTLNISRIRVSEGRGTILQGLQRQLS